MKMQIASTDGRVIDIETHYVDGQPVLSLSFEANAGTASVDLNMHNVRGLVAIPLEFVAVYQPRSMGEMFQLYRDMCAGSIRKEKAEFEAAGAPDPGDVAAMHKTIIDGEGGEG